ncbi:hypothetical protein TrCOL_g10262 [Triparma columacea]|uniref:F-box domain-containing protein n=1 Tax=Triparma columacea TaxID=722753 RepID=A0A9W7L2V7_9STRA|nr:hypothetical protein TrCOL_g10262 [Triparma columacea]
MANIFIEIVPDLTINVATFLCIADLLALEATCTALRKFYTSASVDKFLYSPFINALRVGKCLSPRIEAKLATISSCKTKYRFLVEDSRRDLIDAEELCSLTWAFRFKEPAGEFWLMIDPYWSQSPYFTKSYLRRFEADGLVSSIPLLSGEIDPLDNWAQGANLTIRWRFTRTRLGKRGHYLQINRWPSMVIERDPITWGWKIHNQWVAYLWPSDPSNLQRLHESLELDIDRFL